MTAPKQMSVNLPFQGFCDSDYSAAIDSEESQWVENQAGSDAEYDSRGEFQFPPELRLSESELCELLMAHTRYSVAHQQVARGYTDAFDDLASDALGFPLGLKFEVMTSPRFYNFETDRIFAFIPQASVRRLFALSKADGHATLAGIIGGRFTSYDGFASSYPNGLAAWLSKPVRDWDHNEVSTLLIAALRLAGVDDWSDFERDLYERCGDGNGEFYSAWESAVDWPAFEQARDALRADKFAAHQADNPDYIAPAARHPDQIDFPFMAEAQG